MQTSGGAVKVTRISCMGSEYFVGNRTQWVATGCRRKHEDDLGLLMCFSLHLNKRGSKQNLGSKIYACNHVPTW